MKRKMKKQFLNDSTGNNRSISCPNEINTSVEIPMYAPNLGLMPKEYQLSPQLYEFERNFKDVCMEFLTTAHPDQYNSSYMDAVIEKICDDAKCFVEVQRCDHERLITDVLHAMHDGDLEGAKDRLQLLLSDKDCNEKELMKLRRIHWAGTSFAEEV